MSVNIFEFWFDQFSLIVPLLQLRGFSHTSGRVQTAKMTVQVSLFVICYA